MGKKKTSPRRCPLPQNLTLPSFAHWIRHALPGSRTVYYVGNLAATRARTPVPIADLAWKLYESNHLVLHQIPPYYIAVRK